MPNPLQVAGAQPPRPSHKAPLYQGARFTSGYWSNRAPLRDAASTRSEEKFYGPRGDALIGGENIEISNRLTLVRRPGNSVWNDNLWTGINSFYEFRQFNSSVEEIKTLADTTSTLYDASNNSQIPIWSKLGGAGQSYMQSVGNSLYWGDGVSQKKWLTTLQSRIPFVSSEFVVGTNPYNFTPYDLHTFIVDNNGNAEQLIGACVQLQSFYILDNTIVFYVLPSLNGYTLPNAAEILVPGLEVYFKKGSVLSSVLGLNSGVTLTVSSIVGPVAFGGGFGDSPTVFNGGAGYVVNDTVNITQTSQTGSQSAQAKVATVGTSAGIGYTNATALSTTTNGSGLSATVTIITSFGGLSTGSIVNGGTGYSLGDYIYPTQATGSGGFFKVTGETGGVISIVALVTGIVTSVGRVSPSFPVSGTGYVTADNVSTTGGTGTGLTLNINVYPVEFSCSYNYSGGPVTGTPTVVSGGINYVVGDKVYPVETSQPTATGAVFTVSTVSSGVITGLTLTSGGTGYVAATGLSTTTNSSSGSGATVTIAVANASDFPSKTTTDIPTIFSGGIPISDARPNSAVVWPKTQGVITNDGSAVWINRGPTVDGGLVYNWGIKGPTTAPSVTVNGAVEGWQANTYYNQWQIILDSNGNIQQLVTPGKSGGTHPTWAATVGVKTADGTAAWVCYQIGTSYSSGTQYPTGTIVEETVSSVDCLFQLQAPSGLQFQGSSIPAYVWNCPSQGGSDIGAAGEWNNGSSNSPMAGNGAQPVTAGSPFSGSIPSLALENDNTNLYSFPVDGVGAVGSSSIFYTRSGDSREVNVGMFPTFIVPEAGNYTFSINHENAMFWGIGSGNLSINIVSVTVQNDVLTVTCNRQLSSILTPSVSLTIASLTKALFLNGQTFTVTGVSGNTWTANYVHADYGPQSDTGTATSGPTLVPTVISGPMNWINPGSPNTYDFSTGTPIKGYPIMSAEYPPNSAAHPADIVVINFPAAGTYPAEIQWGYYDEHNAQTYPTVSPALPGGAAYNFLMVYSPPGSSTFYQILPQSLAAGSTPSWPAWAVGPFFTVYPSVVDSSGNQTWWNIGPASTFNWLASTNYTTQTYIIDTNGNQQIPYEAGVSGTIQPTFSTTLYNYTYDLPNLVWYDNGPTGNTPNGTISTFNGGWSYCVALVDTLDDTVSNAGLVSVSTGNFFSATGVFISGGVPASPDPQSDYVAVFRTDDGGATYYLVPPPPSGNGNTEYTIPLSQYLSQGFTDTNQDANLNFLLEAPVLGQNTPPKVGFINPVYSLNRIFGSLGNTVYWSTGPNTPIGNGINGFSPNNYAEFPSLVKRLVPLNIGMVVFTSSDIYILQGDGETSPIVPYPFLQKLGLLSYNALTVNGSIIYFLSTDGQVLELNVHSGVSQVGFPIADQFSLFNPLSSYLTWHVSGSNDQCLFAADGSTKWFRMSPTAAPESGTLTWSPEANIVGGVGCISSQEASPGNIQLLLGPPPGTSGQILFRDYTTNTDNGEPYSANFILGSLVLAHPGQVAAPEFITTDCLRVPGSLPISLGVRIGEISGPFEDLIFWTNDPPQLPPSNSLYNQRFYLSQTKQSVLCRHMQILGQWEDTDSQDELYTLTVFGGFSIEG